MAGGEVSKLRNARFKIGDWKERADELDALAFATLAEAGKAAGAMLEYLLRDRAKLAPAGLAQLGLGLQKLGRREDLAGVLRNLEQYLVEDAENQTAWLKLPGDSWWYWWGSETETLAAYLKLLARTDPKGARAAGLAKYLLNNRKHGTYWNSTRDTALAIEALAEFLRASGEDRPDMTVEILLDGAVKRTVRITGDDLFTFDNTLRRRGRGPRRGKAHARDPPPRRGAALRERRPVLFHARGVHHEGRPRGQGRARGLQAASARTAA